MKINTIISPDDIIVGLKANSKKQVLHEMVARLTASVDGLETRLVFDHLMDRERLGCTSIGGGIAIPHTRCAFPENIGNKPLTQLAVLNKPIDFQSNDDHPVDIVFMLIAPDHIGGEHLTALALASRLLRDEDRAAHLRGCDSVEAVWSILNNAEISDAA